MQFRCFFLAATIAAVLSGCAATGTKPLDRFITSEDIDKDTKNLMFRCGQSGNISDEAKQTYEVGLKELLKGSIGGKAQFEALNSQTSSWKLEQPDYAIYLTCISEQTKLLMKKYENLELKAAQLTKEIKGLKQAAWINEVAIIRMKADFENYRRLAHQGNLDEFDILDIESKNRILKKKV